MSFRPSQTKRHPHAFDLIRTMRTPYRIDDFQQVYFVINSIDQLLSVTLETDFAPHYMRLEREADVEIKEVLAEDEVIARGTQAYAAERAEICRTTQ